MALFSKNKTFKQSVLALGLGLTISLPTLADQQQDFKAYVEGLKQEALTKGISQKTIDEAFKNVTFKPRAVSADKNQPEKKKTLDEYLPQAVPTWKVNQAKRMYNENYDVLQRIGEEYGVQPRFIVALWGVESNFGRFTGNYSVIDAVTTMAFEGRREELFRKQTMAALQILEEGHVSAANLKGSWAGAMGQPQFMPTSFLTYAADGDGDGKKDIWNNKADVFASTANYLKTEGWNDEYTWGRQVKVPVNINPDLQGREQEKGKYLQEWAQLGITNLNGEPLPQLENDIKAWLIMPDDAAGRTYLVYNNYNVLMHWNRSYYFALAVSHLADRIGR